MAEHDVITDPEIHEPKGSSTATSGQVYVANGAGSGVWTTLDTSAPITGTFTPTVSFSTIGNFVPAYTTQTGKYIRTNDQVWFTLEVQFTANAYTTSAGEFMVSSLPFPSTNTTPSEIAVSIGKVGNIDLGTNDTQVTGAILQNSSNIQFWTVEDDAVATPISVIHIPASQAGVTLTISGVYEVA